MKKRILSLAVFHALLLAGSDVYAASYAIPGSSSNAEITLNNISLDGVNANSSKISASLSALDDGELHGGQIFQINTTNDVNGPQEQDALYFGGDSKLYIPNLTQNAFLSYNATLLLTNTQPMQFTVINLTTTSNSDGAETKVVFNKGDKGDKGDRGAVGPDGVIGPAGADGPAGPAGLAGAVGAVGAVGPAGPAGPAGATGVAGPAGSDGPAGPAGAVGPAGAPGGSLALGQFYALMPPDNAATVAPGTDVSFPQDGPTGGTDITRTDSSTFNLAAIGIYEVSLQVSVTEAGQLILTLNGADLNYTVAGRATGTSQITNQVLVQTSMIDSSLTVRNPAGNSTALTITPLAGGTRPVSASLIIKRLQ